MAFSGNYLTITEFMAEVHDRFRFVEFELDEMRIKEWLHRATGLIGVNVIYKSLRTELTLTQDEDLLLSYTTIPSGIIQINSITDGSGIPLIYSSAIPGWDDRLSPPCYNINGTILFCNICDTNTLMMTYDSFPVDDDGNPLIPDVPEFIEAMLAYVGYRIGQELWYMDRMNERKYRDLEREWLWYVKSAAVKLRIPSLDQMQALVNQQQKIMQSPRQHSYRFRLLNNPTYQV